MISDSLLLIYLFWELVGFSSYLLIGFWFSKHDIPFVWEGLFNDKEVMSGVYVVMLTYLFNNNGVIRSRSITGDITVIR